VDTNIEKKALEAIESLAKDIDLMKAKDLEAIKKYIKILDTKIEKLSPTIDPHSPTIGEITKALSKAVAHRTEFSRSGSGARGEYLKIEDYWGTFDVPLSSNGLDMKFTLWENKNGSTTLIGILSHESGEWFKSTAPITPEDKTIQANGYNQAFLAATTYMKRNMYGAMMGV